MRLERALRKQLYAALEDAFPNRAGWDKVIELGLGEKPDLIIGPGPDYILKTITWAETEDRIEELAEAAQDERSTNELLKAVVATLKAAMAGATPGGGVAPVSATASTDPGDEQRLFQALVDLDFKIQTDATRRAAEMHRYKATFLVHGPTNQYGQRFLVHRLINQRLWKHPARVCPINIGGSDGVAQTAEGLWGVLSS